MTLVDREQVASRLLRSSAKLSYDPETELDWDADLDPTLFAIPEQRVSLYGTPLWERMSHEQRVQLSWHEFASTASVGLWFELILMQGLLRYAYDQDPHSAHIQYCLTEIGDETRHSVMFARAAQKLAPGSRYRPPRLTHELGRFYKTLAAGPALFASVLVAEETLDRLQRESLSTPGLLPFAQDVCRIHVTEEARHVAYARTAVERQVARLSRRQLEWHRAQCVVTSVFVVAAFRDPAVYTAVGLDKDEAVRQARANPYTRETRRWMAERVTGFLADAGMISGPTSALWRRAGLVA
ncbi:MAG: putative rane protein [Frankiales bacterium]|nr:putative rane protein [Frankiales bacterium]